MSFLLYGLIALGFISIIIEDLVHIDKAKTTLFFGSLVWMLYFMFPPSDAGPEQIQHALNENLLEIATLWLFLVAAMTFVVYLSSKGIIDGIVNALLPKQMSERMVMLLTGLFAFIFSSMADNITSTLVCISVLFSLKLSPDKLLRYMVLIIFAVNSGGAALITGDVTTLMIFLAGKVEILDLLWISLPALLGVLALTAVLSIPLKGQLQFEPSEYSVGRGDMVIGLLFLATIVITISGNIVYDIPPVLSFLFGLSLMFMVLQFMNRDEPVLDYVRRIEFDTLLFFLGVLLLVGMLKELHVLDYFPALYELMPTFVANYLVGLASALFDNVPLTAALLQSGIQMSPSNWLGLTYSVGVGGSLLIIGSAAGVVAMSKIESLTFVSYLRFLLYLLFAFTLGYAAVIGLSQLIV